MARYLRAHRFIFRVILFVIPHKGAAIRVPAQSANNAAFSISVSGEVGVWWTPCQRMDMRTRPLSSRSARRFFAGRGTRLLDSHMRLAHGDAWRVPPSEQRRTVDHKHVRVYEEHSCCCLCDASRSVRRAVAVSETSIHVSALLSDLFSQSLLAVT